MREGRRVQELLEKQAERDAKEEARFQELMRQIFSGMANEDGVMKETNDVLTREKNNHDDRQAATYKLWEKQIYHNINEQIAKKLKKLSPDQIMNKLRKNPPLHLRLVSGFLQLFGMNDVQIVRCRESDASLHCKSTLLLLYTSSPEFW